MALVAFDTVAVDWSRVFAVAWTGSSLEGNAPSSLRILMDLPGMEGGATMDVKRPREAVRIWAYAKQTLQVVGGVDNPLAIDISRIASIFCDPDSDRGVISFLMRDGKTDIQSVTREVAKEVLRMVSKDEQQLSDLPR